VLNAISLPCICALIEQPHHYIKAGPMASVASTSLLGMLSFMSFLMMVETAFKSVRNGLRRYVQNGWNCLSLLSAFVSFVAIGVAVGATMAAIETGQWQRRETRDVIVMLIVARCLDMVRMVGG
jgi:amino acid permease